MAKADQIKALIKSHADGDEARFYAIAMQVAASEARRGHGKLATELRKLVDEAKGRRPVSSISPKLRPTPIGQPRGELASLLTVSYPTVRFTDMALSPAIRSSLAKVLQEQQQRELIRSHGFGPIRKILLVGPPGTGKTMTASVLAGELGIPLFAIQLHGLITKYLGETAAKLGLVFKAMAEIRGVYFFDEFDALGSERGTPNEVGEIRRILNSFLQFLEQDESDSLPVAATNYRKLLDRALFRRFDRVVEFQLPGKDIAIELLRNKLAAVGASGVDWPGLSEAVAGLSHAEITAAADDAAKTTILCKKKSVSTSTLRVALEERKLNRA